MMGKLESVTIIHGKGPARCARRWGASEGISISNPSAPAVYGEGERRRHRGGAAVRGRALFKGDILRTAGPAVGTGQKGILPPNAVDPPAIFVERRQICEKCH